MVFIVAAFGLLRLCRGLKIMSYTSTLHCAAPVHGAADEVHQRLYLVNGTFKYIVFLRCFF